MKRMNETVLYYTPENTANVTKLKGVLVRMGIRIKNVAPEQMMEPIGGLLGMPGFKDTYDGCEEQEGTVLKCPEVTEQVLIMHNFSGSRLDELLVNLRKAGVPKIDLKAVVTESNAAWTFYKLYEEIKEEHEKMEEAGK